MDWGFRTVALLMSACGALLAADPAKATTPVVGLVETTVMDAGRFPALGFGAVGEKELIRSRSSRGGFCKS
jgi:hypothetical protein